MLRTFASLVLCLFSFAVSTASVSAGGDDRVVRDFVAEMRIRCALSVTTAGVARFESGIVAERLRSLIARDGRSHELYGDTLAAVSCDGLSALGPGAFAVTGRIIVSDGLVVLVPDDPDGIDLVLNRLAGLTVAPRSARMVVSCFDSVLEPSGCAVLAIGGRDAKASGSVGDAVALTTITRSQL